MKRIFFEVLDLLVDDLSTIRWVLVGDELQMLYNYDPDDAADLSYFAAPETHFGAPFIESRLSTSFRLTPHLATFANALLDPSCAPLRGGNTRAENAAVDVICCGSREWKAHVVGYVEKYAPLGSKKSTMILCAYKKGNTMLKQVANILAEHGYSVFVQGVDVASIQAHSNVVVSSFHSSKGSEADVVVVLDANFKSAHNPLHVAVTRSRAAARHLQQGRHLLPRQGRAASSALASQRAEEARRARQGVPGELAEQTDRPTPARRSRPGATGGTAQPTAPAGPSELCRPAARPAAGAAPKHHARGRAARASKTFDPEREMIKDLSSWTPPAASARSGTASSSSRRRSLPPSNVVEDPVLVSFEREANVSTSTCSRRSSRWSSKSRGGADSWTT